MSDLDSLIASAISLKLETEKVGTGPAQDALAIEIDRVNDEIDLNTLLPDTGGGLGLAAQRRDPDAFFKVFSDRIRSNLCIPDGEFNKLIRQGLHTSVGAILTALVAALSIPAVALSLLVPIAVLICHSGLEAYCIVSE